MFASIDFYENCRETDNLFKGDKEPTKPWALFQNWRQDLFQYLFQDNMQSTDYSRASEVPSRRQKEDTNQILRPIQGPSDPHNSMKPHSKIDIGIIFGYENVYMKQHLRSQDVCQKYCQSTANAKIYIPARPKVTLMPTRHAPQFVGRSDFMLKQMRPNSFGYISSSNISD